jgi:hypothetical protein
MQFDDDAGGVGAEQRGGVGRGDGGSKPKAPYKPRKSSPRVAPRKNDTPPDPARSLIPARTVTAPFVGFIPALEEVEPSTHKGDEQGTVIIGRHGKPVKKRDLRNRRGRKRPAYVPRDNPIGNQPFDPTDQQRETVIIMLGMLTPKKVCARLMGCDVRTFDIAFAEEIETGPDRFVASLKGMLVMAAQKGSVRAQTFLLEKLGGPDWAPRMGMASAKDRMEAEAFASASNNEAKVTLYLPDNKRLTNDG